jgi:ABC-type multidrug transport system fused ATPase/permease subunit
MSYADFCRALWRLFDRRERLLLCVLILGMTAGAALETLGIGLVVPLISAIGNPALIHDNKVFNTVYQWTGARTTEQFLLSISILLLAVYTIKNLYLGLLAFLQSSFIFRKQAQLSHRLLRYYLGRPYTFHLQQNSADLQFNVMGAVANVTGGILSPLLLALSEVLVLAFVLALLFVIEPRATLVAIVVVAVLALAYQKVFKGVLTRHGRASSIAAKGMHRTVRQALGSIKEIKISGRESHFASAFYSDGLSYVRSAGIFAALNAIPRLLTELLVVGGLLLAVVALLMQPGALERAFPLLALVGAAALRVMPSFTRITGALTSIRFNVASVHTLSLDTLQASAEPSQERHDEKTLPAFQELELRDVHHQYAGADSASLVNVGLKIRRGEYVGIVGSTGAGKTTLINVILGLLDPTQGSVLIGSEELPKVRTQWQRTIGYVPQSIYLLDDSVRRNVAFGLADAEIRDQDVWSALDAARVGDLVRSLPKQLATRVGENGIRLSGGERQRIGIARALFANPQVVIFDEATSSLDNQTEREVTETIAALGGERTVIVITHRLSAVTRCDRIYLVSGGKIVDAGAYEDLLARSEGFRRMADESLR